VRTYTCLSDGAKRRAFDLERWKNSYALSAIQFHIRLAVLVESQGLTKFCKV
jgi:repressor of nif and glnA expression